MFGGEHSCLGLVSVCFGLFFNAFCWYFTCDGDSFFAFWVGEWFVICIEELDIYSLGIDIWEWDFEGTTECFCDCIFSDCILYFVHCFMVSTDGVVYLYVIFFCFIVGVWDIKGDWKGVCEIFCCCSAVGDINLIIFGKGELGCSGDDPSPRPSPFRRGGNLVGNYVVASGSG